MKATRLLWESAGRPAPTEGDGTPIKAGEPASCPCAMCGAEGPRFGFFDALSESFWNADQVARMFPYADGAAHKRLCDACVWCAKTLALRCACWIVTTKGIWWIPRSGLLAILLDPPEPPFAIGYPAYGIAHGGETHAWRATWCGRVHETPLIRLQSKHVAIYAEVATSRVRFPLQVDDGLRVIVEPARWSRIVSELTVLVSELRAAGVGATDLRASLVSLRPPPRTPYALLSTWHTRVAPYRAHARAAWWRVLVDLLPMPALPPKPEKAPKAPAKNTQAKPQTTPTITPATPAARASGQLSLL